MYVMYAIKITLKNILQFVSNAFDDFSEKLLKLCGIPDRFLNISLTLLSSTQPETLLSHLVQ